MKKSAVLIIALIVLASPAAPSAAPDLLTLGRLLRELQTSKENLSQLWELGTSHAAPGVANAGLRHFMTLSESARAKLLAENPGLRRLHDLTQPDRIGKLDEKSKEIKNEIRRTIRDNPGSLRGLVEALHHTGGPTTIDDETLDGVFGMEFEQAESRVKWEKFHGRANPDKVYLLTHYDDIRELFLGLGAFLGDSDVVYDLGSGYGRVLLYGALLFPKTRFKGIEIVPERADESLRLVRENRITNASVINKDVLDVDFSDGTVFYLNNPFTRPILDTVIERLRKIALKRKITVVSVGLSSRRLKACPWLRVVDISDPVWWRITQFQSDSSPAPKPAR